MSTLPEDPALATSSPETPAATTPDTAAPATPSTAAETAHTAAQLAERFPALFKGAAKPLKLRIQADIQERAPGVFTKQALSACLRRHTGATSYLIAVSKGEQRFDLDGQPAGELSEEHRQVATEELARRRAKRQARAEEEAAGRRARAQLLREHADNKLPVDEFCAAKGIDAAQLEPLLAQARQEAEEAAKARTARDARGQRDGQRPDRRERRDGPNQARRGPAGGPGADAGRPPAPAGTPGSPGAAARPEGVRRDGAPRGDGRGPGRADGRHDGRGDGRRDGSNAAPRAEGRPDGRGEARRDGAPRPDARGPRTQDRGQGGQGGPRSPRDPQRGHTSAPPNTAMAAALQAAGATKAIAKPKPDPSDQA